MNRGIRIYKKADKEHREMMLEGLANYIHSQQERGSFPEKAFLLFEHLTN